jgi:nicotine blue oxidoreductase
MIEAIVLAAGKGERLGGVKPLLDAGGEPALARIVRALRAAGIEAILVVLGHAADRIRREVDLSRCRVVVNPNYESGMASSLSLGIRSLSPEAEGFLVLHADMPFLARETIRAVVEAGRRGARIAAPTYRGERGFPVYFCRACVEDLLPTLTGEAGGRRFLAAHREETVLIPVDDAGAVRDVDRPEDREREEKDHEHRVH